MSNDLAIHRVATAQVDNDNTEPAQARSVVATPAATAPAARPIINPTLRLDPALGLVVIEFRSDDGTITTSIPSERQLKAYQRWQTGWAGATPPGGARVHAPEQPSRAGAADSGDPAVVA